VNFFIQTQPFKKMSVNSIYNKVTKKARKTVYQGRRTLKKKKQDENSCF